MNKKNVSCKNINLQWFPRLAHAWDGLWYDIVSVDQIAHGKCDCRTVILAIIFYRSLVSESSVTSLGVYTRRWVYDNITPHSLCYLARVRPVGVTASHVVPSKWLMSNIHSKTWINLYALLYVYIHYIVLCMWHCLGIYCWIYVILFICSVIFRTPGGRLNKKDGLTGYGDSHVKDKTS